jgi:DNA polymerase III epsilon subunit-like protein
MIVTDLETTGTNPEKHSIVSIGAIDMLDPQRTFYAECRIWEGAHIEEKSLEINDMTRDDALDESKKTEGQIVGEFLAWAMESNDHTIAAHNPVFDLSFLEEAAARSHANFPLARRSVDQHSVALTHMLLNNIEVPIEKGRTAINSDFIMKYVGIPTEPRPHNALNGALWEAEALSRMLYNKNLLEQFQGYEIPWKV